MWNEESYEPQLFYNDKRYAFIIMVLYVNIDMTDNTNGKPLGWKNYLQTKIQCNIIKWKKYPT